MASPPTFAGQGGSGQDLVGPPAHDLDPGRAGLGQGQHHRPGGPPDAEDQAPLRLGRPPEVGQRVDETGPVGAVADQLATHGW